jgi:hypothetical protein
VTDHFADVVVVLDRPRNRRAQVGVCVDGRRRRAQVVRRHAPRFVLVLAPKRPLLAPPPRLEVGLLQGLVRLAERRPALDEGYARQASGRFSFPGPLRFPQSRSHPVAE